MSRDRDRTLAASELAPRAPAPTSSSVTWHIERLVLDGWNLNALQRVQVGASLEQELARLVRRTPSTWSEGSGTALPRVIAPAIPLAAQSTPAQLGREVARSIFASLRSAG